MSAIRTSQLNQRRSMSERGLFVLFASALLAGCSSTPQQAPPVRISAFYESQDTLGYTALIDSSHFAVRFCIDGVLDSLIVAKSEGTLEQKDLFLRQVEWLTSLYQLRSGVKDLAARYALYLQWDSATAARKLELDSMYRNIDGGKLSLDDFAEALRELAREYDSIGDSFRAASTHYRMADAYYRQRQTDSCLACLRRCIQVSSLLDIAPLLGDSRYMLGNVHSLHEANYGSAEKEYLEAIHQFRRTDRPGRTYLALYGLGTILFQLNQTDQALRSFSSALAELESDKDPYFRALCEYGLAEVFYDKGALDSALHYACLSENSRRSVAAIRAAAESELGYPVSLQGLIYQSLCEYKRAAGCYERAGRLFRDAGENDGFCLNLYRMASLAIDERDYAGASSLYREVLAQTSGGMFEWRAFSIYGLALCDYYLGFLDNAKARLRSCIDLTEMLRRKLTSPVISASALTDKIGFYDLLSTIYVKEYMNTGNEAFRDSAFHYLERSKAYALIQSLSAGRMSDDFTEQETVYLGSLSRLQSDLALGQGSADSIREALRQLEDSLFSFRLRSGVAEVHMPTAYDSIMSVRDMTGHLLEDNCILLEYLLSEFGSYVFAVSRDDVTIHEIPVSRDSLGSLVSRYLALIGSYPTAGRTAVDLRPYGSQLHSLLIPDKLFAAGSPNRMIIVPSGYLHALPFGCLIDHGGRYLVESFEISYAPSTRILTLLRSRPQKQFDHNRVLAFGDPLLPDTGTSFGAGFSASYGESEPDPIEGVRAMKTLSASGREMACMASIFGDDLVTCTGAAATETAVKSADYSQIRYLHFATHGVVNNRNPERSFLLLSPEEDAANDGFLQPPEIAGLQTDVDLVFLSACETGIGKTYPGEGSLNMARPFLVAGCNSVVATSWAVDDRFAAEFVCEFYTLLGKGFSKSASLSLAKRKMLESDAELYRDPYFWGPFFLVGLRH